MKIVAFSDLHGQQGKKLTRWFNNNPADLLIFAGDLQANQIDDSGERFVDWAHDLPYTYKIFTFGNHDGNYNRTKEYSLKKYPNDIIWLINESYEIDGIKIFASPHSVQYGRWWFMMLDEELDEIWCKIPDDTNLLITHAPAYGILDRTCDGFTTGSKTLLRRINQLKNLKYHIFGHIHESYGLKVIDGITFMNVALLNEKYRYANNPISFEFETGTSVMDYNVGE